MDIEPILAVYASLKEQRSPWESWWDSLRKHVLPRREGYTDDPAPSGGKFRLYDTTAVEACQKLASGHMSYMTPSNELWFKWSSPEANPSDEAESWYNQCSEIANRELAASNFYTEMHECFLDRVALGTGSLYGGSTRSGRLLFRHVECGSFACAENDEGAVDTYFREFALTPHQAERQFGAAKLGPKVRDMLRQGKNPHGPRLRFLHAVRPREKRNRRRDTALNMPFESLYISLDDRMAVEESGYREFPYLVTRFLKWGTGPYGLSPARLVYPDIHQAQFLNRILDMLGEVAAYPRVLELANQIGEVDMRAGGRTVITPEAASLGLPREWATQGRYDVGMDRLKQKQESIRRAFFIPMLELWSEDKRQLTAAEVYARENERILAFSPSFTLFVSDLQPMMMRVFALLFRMGKFPKPPESVIREEGGEGVVPEPGVVYQSKIAQILRRTQSEGIARTLRRLGELSGMAPDLVDHLDLDQTFRATARMDGVPESVLRSNNEVLRLRREREDAAAAAAEAQAQLEGGGNTASALSSYFPALPQ